MGVQSCGGWTAFMGGRRVAAGEPSAVAEALKGLPDDGGREPLLAFEDATGRQVAVDLRGSLEDVRAQLEPDSGQGADEPTADAPRGPGRPKLGVVAREVTLLPRHWEWLGEQPGGASVALRKLVEEARKANVDRDRVRKAREAAYRFITAMAGDLPGYEEANRALFAGDADKFSAETEGWPADVRDHARLLVRAAS